MKNVYANDPKKKCTEWDDHAFHHPGSLSSACPKYFWTVERLQVSKTGDANRAMGLCQNECTIVHNHKVCEHADGSWSCSCQNMTRLSLPCSHILVVLLRSSNVSEIPKPIKETMKAWSIANESSISLLRLIANPTDTPTTKLNALTQIRLSDMELAQREMAKIQKRLDIVFSASGYDRAIVKKVSDSVTKLVDDLMKVKIVAASAPGIATSSKKRGKGNYDRGRRGNGRSSVGTNGGSRKGRRFKKRIRVRS